MITVASIVDYLQRLAPRTLAESWDNVGLLLGDSAGPASRIMTCLSVTPTCVAEAVAERAELIVTHHPVLFRPTQRLTSETPEGRLLLPLLRAGIAVHSPHTAFDNCANGINDLLCRKLGLTDVQPLRPVPANQCKIVAFVPDQDLGKVSDALFSAGAGVIGEYTKCSFRLAGTGTFLGSEASNPTVGQKGRREEVSEWRLEVVCPQERVAAAVKAMRSAHSYEEPTLDIYPLQPGPSGTGAGRLGTLPQSESLRTFANRVQMALAPCQPQVVGLPTQAVKRVAVACGAAGDLLKDAMKANADVFLTGELRFHEYLAAQAAGLALVLPGHYATERPGVEHLASLLQEQFPEVQIWASRCECDPVWTPKDS
jgi:dinuclear metal center YbgI/SA1388 family protein